MKRRNEPELMDEASQVAAYALADFEEPNNRFLEIFRSTFPEKHMPGSILDLGCGPGDILARFAESYPECSCLGVDGSGKMLDFARNFIAQQGLDERVDFVMAKIPTDKLLDDAYDVILSNSLLHHLSDPDDLWRSVKRYGRKECRVLVVDLLRPETEDEAQKIVHRYAANEPDILQHDFFYSLLAAYTLDEVKQQLDKAELHRLSLEQISDRHWAVKGKL
ncbi:MAG: class I SAM-dependent methyltransferase [Pseudomonadota bacterium]